MCPKEDTDNKDGILLPEQLFIKKIDLELHNLIASTKKEDKLRKNTKMALQNKQLLPLNSHPFDWRIEDDLLFYKDKCYIPDNLKV